VNDYPSMIAAVNHVEPVPRRVRAYLGQQLILDTIQALYVWEWPNYPQYYIPQADVHREYLVDQMTTQQTRRGKARVFGLSAHDVADPEVVDDFADLRPARECLVNREQGLARRDAGHRHQQQARDKAAASATRGALSWPVSRS
jgi:uncharacterized protein (DUF427 family)